MLSTYIKNGNNKSYIIALVLLISFFFLERFFHEKIRLKIQKVAFTEIKKISPDNEIDSIDYFYFPPKLIFKGANLSDKSGENSLKAGYGYVSLKVFPLIGGKIKISEVYVRNANLTSKVKQTKAENESLKLNLNFLLKNIPVEAVHLEKTLVSVKQKAANYLFDISDIRLTKTDTKIWLNAKSNNVITIGKKSFNFDLNTDLNWGQKGIFITTFKLDKGESKISLTGLFKEKIIEGTLNRENPLNYTNEVRSSSTIKLTDIQDVLFLLSSEQQKQVDFLKGSSGTIKIKGNLLAEDNLKSKREGRLKVSLRKIDTKFTKLNSLKFSAQIDSEKVLSDDFVIDFSKSSRLKLKGLELKRVKKGLNISFNAESKRLELRDILKNINANADNTQIPFNIKGNCDGNLFKKDTLIKCRAKGKVFSGLIKGPSGSKGAIVDIGSANYDLESFMSNKDIKIQVLASRKDSKASATGIVNFKEGFSFDIDAPEINYTNFLKELASSKLDGIGSLKGNVRGSAREAQFNFDTKNTGLEFNELFLEDADFFVSYKYPNVSIKDIKGDINTLPYSGEVGFDVKNDILKISIQSEKLDTNVITKIFSKKFDFPKDIKFEGDLNLNASGPPNIDIMDLKLDSNIKNISVFTESFREGKLSLNGFGGDWKVDDAFMIDQNKGIYANGSLNGLKTIDIKLKSSKYNSSTLNILKDLGLNISGPINFSLDAIGPLEGPKATGKVYSSNLNGSFRAMGSLDIDYRLYQEGFKWSGQLFSKSIKGEGYNPFDSDQPFSFNGTLDDFDLINILDIAKESTKKPVSKLSANLYNLETTNLATGYLKGRIENANLSFTSPGIKSLYLKQMNPVNTFRDKINVKVYQNTIANGDLKFYFKNLNNMSFSKKGILDLGFIEPLIPGTEQMSALLESDFELVTRNGVTTGSGASFLKGFSYRNESFPYTFNSGESKITWHSNHAAFSDISASLNGSKINGFGKVRYNPNFFIDFLFKYNNLRIELPDKINSNSNGALYLKGSRLPFNLSGFVNVNSGVFALDLLAPDSSTTIQPSHLLPNSILKEDNSPFRLDLDIRLKKPFEINSSEVRGFATGNFNLHGLTSNPRMTGKLRLQKGTKIIYQDKQFLVNEGNIVYANKPPNNPAFFIDVDSKITDKNSFVSTEYDVRVILKGSGSDPKLEFYSQPSLEENQITSLIAFGTTSTQTLDQEIGQEQQATQAGLQAGSYLLQKNKAVKDFQNQTGTEIEISSSVDSGGVSPKVGINKSWTPKFSSNLSQTFGVQKKISLDNKYKINKNLSTVIKLQNSRTDDASLIINRRVPDGNILGLDLEYNVEFK